LYNTYIDSTCTQPYRLVRVYWIGICLAYEVKTCVFLTHKSQVEMKVLKKKNFNHLVIVGTLLLFGFFVVFSFVSFIVNTIFTDEQRRRWLGSVKLGISGTALPAERAAHRSVVHEGQQIFEQRTVLGTGEWENRWTESAGRSQGRRWQTCGRPDTGHTEAAKQGNVSVYPISISVMILYTFYGNVMCVRSVVLGSEDQSLMWSIRKRFFRSRLTCRQSWPQLESFRGDSSNNRPIHFVRLHAFVCKYQ